MPAQSAHVISPLGPISVTLDAHHRLVAIQHGESALSHPAQNQSTSPQLQKALTAIESFLNGSPQALNALPHELSGGTDLQRATWQAMHGVPRGETISYAQLAARIGQPRAIRAVASACGKNPLPLLYPCHRVVASNGGIGGFGWGLEAKRRLLAAEGVSESLPAPMRAAPQQRRASARH